MINHDDFKIACSKLTNALKNEGVKVPHSKLLELVSQSLGYKNYNTFRSMAPEQICIDTSKDSESFFEIRVFSRDSEKVKQIIKDSYILSGHENKVNTYKDMLCYRVFSLNIMNMLVKSLQEHVELRKYISQIEIMQLDFTKKTKVLNQDNLVFDSSKTRLLSDSNVLKLEKIASDMQKRYLKGEKRTFKILNGINQIAYTQTTNGKGLLSEGGIINLFEENEYAIDIIERDAEKLYEIMKSDNSVFNPEKNYSFSCYLPKKNIIFSCAFLANSSLEINLSDC